MVVIAIVNREFGLGVSLTFFFFFGVLRCLLFIILHVFSQQLVSKLLIQDGNSKNKF